VEGEGVADGDGALAEGDDAVVEGEDVATGATASFDPHPDITASTTAETMPATTCFISPRDMRRGVRTPQDCVGVMLPTVRVLW